MRKSSICTSVALVPWLVTAIGLSTPWAQGHPPSGDAVHHRFDNIERAVEMFEGSERATWQKPAEVVTQLRLRAGDAVADIGAGTGYFARRFAVVVGPDGTVLGLDTEATMVEYMNEDARERGLTNYTARQVQPNDPGLQPQSVDLIFICDTYHHIPERVGYLQLLASALKPGGRVVIVDFKKEPLPLGPPPEWKLTSETVVGEFRQAGYRLARTFDSLPYQYFLEFTHAPTDE